MTKLTTSLICFGFCFFAFSPAFAIGKRLPKESLEGDTSGRRTIFSNSSGSEETGYQGVNVNDYEPDGGAVTEPVTAARGQHCQLTCDGKGSAVQVDTQARCMCVKGKDCFPVDIGYNGPGMTHTGTGTMGVADGVKYDTMQTTTTSYDKDAIRMGIGANDRYGKWIHKSRGCGPGGGARTAGCIGVPCGYWPEVKAQMGKTLTVCRGAPARNPRGVRKSGTH